MSKFISSRNVNDEVQEFEAIIKGLSNNGGLYTPILYNIIDLQNLYESANINNNISYKKIATYIIKYFFDLFDISDIEKYVNLAYDLFDSDDVTPTTKIGDDYLLELYHVKHRHLRM